MKLGKIMEYLRQGKATIDSVLTKLDSLKTERKLTNLSEGEHYGPSVSVEFVDQLGDPSPDRVMGYYQKINDEAAAKRFGATNLEEYSYWAWRACGVANVMSVLKTYDLYDGTLFGLIQELEVKGGYLHQDKWGRKDIGWKHRALKEALTSRGLKAQIDTHLSATRLLHEISKNKLVIASVKSRGNVGSHTVVVSGFVWEKHNPELEIIDPYGLDGQGGKRMISLSDFKSVFLNRGITVWTN